MRRRHAMSHCLNAHICYICHNVIYDICHISYWHKVTMPTYRMLYHRMFFSFLMVKINNNQNKALLAISPKIFLQTAEQVQHVQGGIGCCHADSNLRWSYAHTVSRGGHHHCHSLASDSLALLLSLLLSPPLHLVNCSRVRQLRFLLKFLPRLLLRPLRTPP